MRGVMRAVPFAIALAVVGLASASCKKADDAADARAAQGDDVDGDALALLPGKPLALAHVDVRAMVANQTTGALLVSLAAAYAPGGSFFGIDPNKDIDEVTAGTYSFQGVDVAAVVRGRFDPAALEAKADASVGQALDAGSASTSSLLVKSSYAGHSLYTVANIGVCALSAKTLLAGTETGIRRMLDKIRDHALVRDVDPFLADTITMAGNQKSAIAGAVSFQSQPFPLTIPFAGWLKSLTSARLFANLQEPGLNVSGTLSYPDSDGAKNAATALPRLAALASLSSHVPTLRDLVVQPVEHDVNVSFSVDDRQLRGVLRQLAGSLPR